MELYLEAGKYFLAQGAGICFGFLMLLLYLRESKDRKDAWKTHNSFVKEVLTMFGETNKILEGIKERMR